MTTIALLPLSTFIALGAVVACVVAFPLLRRRSTPEGSGDSALLAIPRAQLLEIEQDLACGLLTEEQVEPLRREAQRRLLSAAALPRRPMRPVSRPARLLIAAMLIFLIPAGAASLYAALGAPGFPDAPDSFPHWMALGHNAAVAEDFPAAVEAYAQAVAFRPDDPDAWAALAMSHLTLAMKEQRPPAEEFFTAAAALRQLAPDSADALYLGGIAAVASGRPDEAREVWQRLLEHFPGGSETQKNLQEQIDRLPPAKRPKHPQAP